MEELLWIFQASWNRQRGNRDLDLPRQRQPLPRRHQYGESRHSLQERLYHQGAFGDKVLGEDWPSCPVCGRAGFLYAPLEPISS